LSAVLRRRFPGRAGVGFGLELAEVGAALERAFFDDDHVQAGLGQQFRRDAGPGAGPDDGHVAAAKRQGAMRPATYADMLASPRYGQAARFFLEDLYGPMDFTLRDDQFARIVPGLVRLFPADIVSTVAAAGRSARLSEDAGQPDGRACPGRYSARCAAMARPGAPWASPRNANADRLMLAVGTALDRYTRNPLLRHSLRLMRGPAQAAGMGVLQAFLERGFDTFGEMRGATEFLDTIAHVQTPWTSHYPPGVPAEADIQAYASLADLLEAAFRRHARRDALDCMDSRLSFGDLDRLSTAFGAWLQSLGLKPGDRVAS
jgi:hypothetical protein